MKPECYHSVIALGLISTRNCNFSGCPTIIAKIFCGRCLFQYDYEHCMGYIPLHDPRERIDEDAT